MKLVIALAAAAAVSAITAAIYVAERMAEPTVVGDPYEEGLHYDEAHRHAHDTAAVGPRAAPSCDPSRAPCARSLEGVVVTLDVSPRPVRAMTDLVFTVTASPPGVAGAGGARIALSMPGMVMGDARVALAPVGDGRWQGRGVIVRCPSGKRTWSAQLELPRGSGQGPLRTSFTFDVAD